jgi:LysR family hydrogen peroxide-inducible transcriptional activator
MHLPTLKQLQYLTALYEHGHFSRAADSCHVTQSTLSAGIRELEALLEGTLVERTRRVVRFTPLGVRIAKKAYAVLREATELATIARAAGKPLSGELRLGVIPTIAPFLLPRLLPRLRVAYPELRLYLREETSGAACEALARGQLDCVLLALPYPCGEVAVARLFDDPFYIAAPAGEPMGEIPLKPQALDDKQLLLLEDGHCLKNHALAACARTEQSADALVLGTSLHTLVQMVDNGLGLTLLPKLALDAGILDGTRVDAHPLEGPAAKREIALVWRRSSPRGHEFQLLAEALLAAEDSFGKAPRNARRATSAEQPVE